MLRYKGCVYITIILVGHHNLFVIAVNFCFNSHFFLSFGRVFAGESKLLRYKHEFVLCVFVVFVLYCIKSYKNEYLHSTKPKSSVHVSM